MRKLFFILSIFALTLSSCTKEVTKEYYLFCWDTNANGKGDPEEDRNGDGQFTIEDCQGKDGRDGKDGLDAFNILMEKTLAETCDGVIFSFYADIDNSGDVTEGDTLLAEHQVCNGERGVDGQDGADGVNGLTPTFRASGFEVSESCPNGGILVEVILDKEVVTSFEICNGQDFIYNYTYELVENPDTCADGGKRIIVYNEEDETVEIVDLCFGITVGEARELIAPLRDYFGYVVTVVTPSETACESGNGKIVTVYINDTEVTTFAICPPPPTLTETTPG